MAPRFFSHVYRNRHGTFYFRLVFPADLQALVKCRERRFSLKTEVRSIALAKALPIIGAKLVLIKELRKMAQHDDTTGKVNAYNKLMLAFIDEAANAVEANKQVSHLQTKNTHLAAQLSESVPNAKLHDVARKAIEFGKKKGTVSLTAETFEAALNKNQFSWPEEKTPMFSELKNAYLEGLSYRSEHSASPPPSEASLSDYGPAIETFMAVMGDMRIGAVNRTVVGRFSATLEKLPPNINKLKKFQGKSIPEIIAMGEKPQSGSNVAKKLGRISSMFKWALDEPQEWGINKNPFARRGGLSGREKSKTARRPFKLNELKLLLSHPNYSQKQFRRSFHFWLIPLGLFTGARLGELCQLGLGDFKEIDSVPCIDLTDEEETKQLKNDNARRLIPIHPELIRMGLLRHVERLRCLGEKLLFNDDELSPNPKRGKVHPASKWFKGFRERVGVNEKQATVFHSFRHTFISTLLDSGEAEHLIAPIVGHEAKLITGTVYWNKKDAHKRKATVVAFKLPDDVLSLFPNVEDVAIDSPARKR